MEADFMVLQCSEVFTQLTSSDVVRRRNPLPSLHLCGQALAIPDNTCWNGKRFRYHGQMVVGYLR